MASGSTAKRLQLKTPTTRERAQQMLERLRSYYAIGRALEAEFDRHGGESLNHFADTGKHGLSKSGLFKARQLARVYDRRAFQELCRLRNSRGLPLTWGHVVELIGVPDESVRLELQQRAAEEGWSRAELAFEIERRYSNRRRGSGRPVRSPRSAEEGLRRLKRKGSEWLRVATAVLDRIGHEPVPKSASWRAELDDTILALEQMEAAIGRGLRQLQAAKRRQRRR